MTTDNPTQLENKLELPERIFAFRRFDGGNSWHYERLEPSDVEYARVTRPYFCSCGGACTAEEYIKHYFELGHDRGGPAPSPSSPVPPEALAQASKLCRSTIPGARVELIFQNLQDAQVVHKWLCNLNTPAATPTPVEPWRDEGGHAWERRSNVDCVECPHCCFMFAAIHGDSGGDDYSCPNCEGCSPVPAAGGDGAQACWVDPDDPRRVKMIFQTAEITSAFVARTDSVGEEQK